MGTIKERPRKDGTIGYTAQIILKRKGKEPHREAETFNKRTEAANWIKNRERLLKAPGGVEIATAGRKTVGETIDLYVESSLKEIGRTKAQVLRSIKKYDLADMLAGDVTSADIVAFATELLATGMKPQTVGNYISHLGAVFAVAKPAWGVPADPEAVRGASSALKRLGATAKSEQRTRRPTLDELDKLMQFFTDRSRRAPRAAPMEKIIPFALFSTRRLSEILRITGEDYDAEHSRVLVRDMKHPGQKIGNDVYCDLVPEAVAFLPPKIGDGAIFPYGEDGVGAAFTRACQVLGIDDLHFHDLRHEGISRLFEMGWDIPHVALVSGHRSWASLQRYTHIRMQGDKYKDWKWLDLAKRR